MYTFSTYQHMRAFIDIPVNPIENTSGDFRKIIGQRDCRAIVMLNPLEESGTG